MSALSYLIFAGICLVACSGEPAPEASSSRLWDAFAPGQKSVSSTSGVGGASSSTTGRAAATGIGLHGGAISSSYFGGTGSSTSGRGSALGTNEYGRGSSASSTYGGAGSSTSGRGSATGTVNNGYGGFGGALGGGALGAGALGGAGIGGAGYVGGGAFGGGAYGGYGAHGFGGYEEDAIYGGVGGGLIPAYGYGNEFVDDFAYGRPPIYPAPVLGYENAYQEVLGAETMAAGGFAGGYGGVVGGYGPAIDDLALRRFGRFGVGGVRMCPC